MNIQWYPGHMTKARRMMQEDIKLIDIIIEILDARVPESSKNPDIDQLAKGKKRLIVLNKADMADPYKVSIWKKFYENNGFFVASMDARRKSDMNSLTPIIMKACREKIERDRKRGIINRPVRAMIVGIPNVGKSTLINSYAGKAVAKTGNKPGVTKGKQWIKLNKQVELLDTPGILWPKFENQETGRKLAMIGSIKDEILETENLALEVIKLMTIIYPDLLKERYGELIEDPVDMLKHIAIARNCKAKGDEPDISKAAALIIDDLRSGKLGRITLEIPEEEN